jgi:hypothetical protein
MQVRILPAASDQYRERQRGFLVRPLAVGRALATVRGTDPCIGSSVEIESAGLRSLRTRVRVSPDALADVAQPGRRAAPRTLLLEVQILSSASRLQVWRNRQTRRSQEPQVVGSNPSTCIEFRGRSSKGRARARHARGWEFKPPRPLQACCLIFSTSGRVDSGAWLQPTSDRFDSGGVLRRFAEVAQSVDARSLNLRTL